MKFGQTKSKPKIYCFEVVRCVVDCVCVCVCVCVCSIPAGEPQVTSHKMKLLKFQSLRFLFLVEKYSCCATDSAILTISFHWHVVFDVCGDCERWAVSERVSECVTVWFIGIHLFIHMRYIVVCSLHCFTAVTSNLPIFDFDKWNHDNDNKHIYYTWKCHEQCISIVFESD